MNSTSKTSLTLLNGLPWFLFAAVFIIFGSLSSKFLDPNNLANILVQSSSTAIVATGMTFVLLTGGVDLSVGAIMFVAAAAGGKLAVAGVPLPWVLACILGVGLVIGALNALVVTRLKVMAFIATLATLYFGRGFALWLTETRAMNLPESFLRMGSSRLLGIPSPIWILAAVLAAAHLALSRTPFGRRVYAVGTSLEIAKKAGIKTPGILSIVYVISGFCAAAGGIVSLSQLGAVSPTFGDQKEFAAIAAAVLGGTSLFGGRGNVLPGTLLGAMLIQTLENGLVILNADPYLYPLVTSAVIFLAVLLDSTRVRVLSHLTRRKIRVEPEAVS